MGVRACHRGGGRRRGLVVCVGRWRGARHRRTQPALSREVRDDRLEDVMSRRASCMTVTTFCSGKSLLSLGLRWMLVLDV
jgi:hypothetical protein